MHWALRLIPTSFQGKFFPSGSIAIASRPSAVISSPLGSTITSIGMPLTSRVDIYIYLQIKQWLWNWERRLRLEFLVELLADLLSVWPELQIEGFGTLATRGLLREVQG